MGREGWWVLGGVVAALFAFLGRAYVAHRAQCRKECREQIERAISLVHEIDGLASDYFARKVDDADCPKLARTITSKLKELGARISSLNVALHGNSLMTAHIRFRQAVSNELDSSSRDTYGQGSECIASITATASALIRYLEQGFQRKYSGILW